MSHNLKNTATVIAMDPITALGLATNVVQLVDVSWRVVSKSREIYTNGALPEHRD